MCCWHVEPQRLNYLSFLAGKYHATIPPKQGLEIVFGFPIVGQRPKALPPTSTTKPSLSRWTRPRHHPSAKGNTHFVQLDTGCTHPSEGDKDTPAESDTITICNVYPNRERYDAKPTIVSTVSFQY